jgi:hypothetical protein
MKKNILLIMFCLLIMGGCQQRTQQTQNQTQVQDSVSTEIPKTTATAASMEFDAEAKPDLTKNAYFIFDGSGSMSDPPDECNGPQKFSDKLSGAKWAIKEFMKKVPDDINIGLYVFDDNGRRELIPLGPNQKKKFINAIDAIASSGGTPLKDSIIFGVNQLKKQYKKQLGYGEYRLIVITDGIAERIPMAVEFANKNDIPIYAIGLCIAEDHPLRTLARSYQAADNFEDLAKGLEQTLAEMPSFDATAFEGL